MSALATTPAEAVAELAAEHWPRFWAGCDAAGAAADILARLHTATVAWGLSNVEVMSGGVVGLVCSATSRRTAVVVKLSPRLAGSEGLGAEGEALAFWRSTGGVVELYDRRDDGYTLLLERLAPGSTLEDSGMRTEDMLSVCGDIARRLHVAGPAPSSFERLAAARPNWLSLLSNEPELRAELRALLADRADDVLIHGDLHGRNILRHADAWRIIDPHAIRADRHAEIQPLLEASLSWGADRGDDRDLAERWLYAYTTAAGMDARRTRRFTVLCALTEARRSDGHPNPGPLDVQWAAGLRRLAEALR